MILGLGESLWEAGPMVCSGGQLFAVDATTGNVSQTSAQLAKGNGIVSGPIVDSTAGLVYVFVATDTGAITCFNGGSPHTPAFPFSIKTLFRGGSGTPPTRGSPPPPIPLYPIPLPTTS